MRRIRAVAWVFGAGLVVTAATGCEDKKKGPEVAPSASTLAASTPPPTSMVKKFKIDDKGTTTIDMPAPNEHIKASTDAATGTLDLDLVNVVNSRGEVKVDLTTLTTKTFKDDAENKKQTLHARTWLEVADGEDGPLPAELKGSNRYAVYAIRSIDGASATDVTKVAPTKDGADDVRTITATTHGEMLIHGHKVNKDAEVEVRFRYPAGGPADKPTGVSIKTKKPFVVTLAEHEVKPRDGVGKIAKRAFSLLGTKVAETASIELDLRAIPQS